MFPGMQSKENYEELLRIHGLRPESSEGDNYSLLASTIVGQAVSMYEKPDLQEMAESDYSLAELSILSLDPTMQLVELFAALASVYKREEASTRVFVCTLALTKLKQYLEK